MKVSKQYVAAEQIDQAIRLLFTNFIVSAVTLAAAAEVSLPDTDNSGGALFELMRDRGVNRTGLSQKELSDQHFNKVRNWLKHHISDVPEIDVQQENAVIMILRAYTKFTSVFGESAVTATMQDFEAWFRENYQHWLQPMA